MRHSYAAWSQVTGNVTASFTLVKSGDGLFTLPSSPLCGPLMALQQRCGKVFSHSEVASISMATCRESRFSFRALALGISWDLVPLAT